MDSRLPQIIERMWESSRRVAARNLTESMLLNTQLVETLNRDRNQFNRYIYEIQYLTVPQRFSRVLDNHQPSTLNKQEGVDKIFEKCTSTVNTKKSADDCRICFYAAEYPIVCTACKKLVGCLSCCKKWAESSMKNSGAPSCPLCRGEWKTSHSVEELATKIKKPVTMSRSSRTAEELARKEKLE